MVKIVLLSTYTTGGAGKACLRLAHALARLGHTVKILVAQERGKDILVEEIGGRKAILTKYLERLLFMPYQVSKKMGWSFSAAKFGINISKHPSIIEADIIHLHWINQGFLSLKNIAQLQSLSKPMVWTLHDMWAFTGGCHHSGNCTNFMQGCSNCYYLKRPRDHDLSTSVFEKKKYIFNKKNWNFVACSKWLHDLARLSLLLSNYPISVIPNPVDTDLFYKQEKSKARAKLSIPERKKLILFIAARVKNEKKGYPYLISMLDLLSEDTKYNRDNLEVIIIGDTEKVNLCESNYIVHYLGNINDEKELTSIYAACDLLIVPSVEENLPNIVMESLACGTPVLAFNTGGVSEMVTHLQQGYIAEHKNVEDLLKGLYWILDLTPKKYEILREKCIKKVMDLYTYKKVAGQYSSLYKNMLYIDTNKNFHGQN